MDKKQLRIVFMGTPQFAVESLKALVEGGYNVVGVITMPDKPAGRGYKLTPSAVKQYALTQGLPVLQPEKLKDEAFLNELKALRADLQIVVAFRMLPQVVWNMPPRGTFNLHASLLPQYRGAAPINWAIINGETETGVTTFFLTHEIDTGNIIFNEKTTIEPHDNAETLHDRLMQIGAPLVLKTVDAIINNTATATEQQQHIAANEKLAEAPKLFKETCRIDWTQSPDRIYNLVRGLSPYPAAWTEFETANSQAAAPNTMKIFETAPIIQPHTLAPGTLTTDNKTYIDVAVNNGFVRILDLQIAGKKRMKTTDFLNGFKFAEGMGRVY